LDGRPGVAAGPSHRRAVSRRAGTVGKPTPAGAGGERRAAGGGRPSHGGTVDAKAAPRRTTAQGRSVSVSGVAVAHRRRRLDRRRRGAVLGSADRTPPAVPTMGDRGARL